MTILPKGPVQPAQSAPISDRFLLELRNTAHAARRGDVSSAEAESLLHCVGPLLDELISRRSAMAGITQLAMLTENVYPIRG